MSKPVEQFWGHLPEQLRGIASKRFTEAESVIIMLAVMKWAEQCGVEIVTAGKPDA